MKKHSFVYKTTNTVNGRQYVGSHSTNNVEDGYLGSGHALLKAVKKYGKDCFTREIIEFLDTPGEAFEKEVQYIEQFNTLQPNGYNLSPTGGIGVVGWCSDETREKLRQARIGKKHSDDVKRKIGKSSIGNKSNTGRNLTKEHKAKLSIILEGNSNSKDNKLSIATRDKMSQSKIGNSNSKGREYTQEQKSSIQLALKRRNEQVLTCPHCGESGRYFGMKRWHFNNCKYNRKVV